MLALCICSTWRSRASFLLACIGYTIGLGNVWRFPYVAYAHGGGAFLLAYFVCLVLLGVPLYLLELALGQAAKAGPVKALRAVDPRLVGVGWAAVLLAGIISYYYMAIIAWALVYVVHSFRSPLPWAPSGTQTRVEAATEFLQDDVLHLSAGIGDMTMLVGPIVGAMAVAWAACFLFVCRGTKSVGIVVWVTATVPFVMLIALMIIAVTKQGAGAGVAFLFKPQRALLADGSTWQAAATQIFFSLGVGLGALVVFASHLGGREDVVIDAIAVPLCNALTSLLAGVTVFAMLGVLAHEEDVPIEDVITSNPVSLAFVVYPAGLATLPTGLAQVASILFFITLFLLGIDSELGTVEVLLGLAVESGATKSTAIAAAYVCVTLFCTNLWLASDAGEYWVQFFDSWGLLLGPFAVCACECIAVTWFYGDDFLAAIQEMRGGRATGGRLWRLLWQYFIPVALLCLFNLAIVFSAMDPSGFYGSDDETGAEASELPSWALALGWLLALSSVVAIVAGLAKAMCEARPRQWRAWRTWRRTV